MKRKTGISLIILSIFIITLCILTSTIIVLASNAKNTATKVSILNEMQTLEEAAKEQLATTGFLPIAENEKGKNIDEILEKVSNKDKEELKKQIEKNSDERDLFFKMDLEKLGVKSTSRGLEKQSSRDVYYITKGNLNVYYLQGVKLEEAKIFTNNSKDKVERNQEQLAYKDIVDKTLEIKKVEKYYSNEINFEINTEIINGEKLYVYLLNGNNNIIYIQDITQMAHAHTYKIARELVDERVLNTAKKIVFILKSNRTEVVSQEFEIKNLDITVPQLQNNKLKVEQEEDRIVAKIYVLDTRSGADKIIYMNKNELQNMEEGEQTLYILNKGTEVKMQKTENSYEYMASLNLKNGEYLAVCVDKAGNILENINIK